jgi:hypothetical protein
MAEPGNESAAGERGHDRLRASHADREQVIGVLKAAFVQGRLTKGELDSRVSQTLAARTYGELAGLTADLPAGLADAVPAVRAAPAQPRPPMSNAAKASLCAVIAVVVAVIVSIPTGGMALFIFAPFYFMALLAAGAQMLANRHDRRSRGQLPPRPAQGGRALEGEQDSKPGDDLMLTEARQDVRAGHAPGDAAGNLVRRAHRRLGRRSPATLAPASSTT